MLLRSTNKSFALVKESDLILELFVLFTQTGYRSVKLGFAPFFPYLSNPGNLGDRVPLRII